MMEDKTNNLGVFGDEGEAGSGGTSGESESYTPSGETVDASSLQSGDESGGESEGKEGEEMLSMDEFSDIHKESAAEGEGKEEKEEGEDAVAELKEGMEGEETPKDTKPPVPSSREEALKGLINPGDEVHFKKLPNASFNYMVSQLKALQEFREAVPKVEAYIEKLKSSAIPESWAEHPEAYTLHKDYKESSAIVEQGTRELAYWEEQLVNVKEGKPWMDIEKNAKGEFIQVEKEPSTRAELTLQKHIATTQKAMEQAAATRDSIKSQFSGMHQKVTSSVEKILSDNFKDIIDDPKHVAWPHIQHVNKTLESFGQSNNPLAPLVSALYGRIAEYRAYLEGQHKASQKASIKAKDTKSSGPTSSNRSALGGKGEEGMLSMDDFDLSSRLE